MDLIKTRCILGSILVIAEQFHQRIALAKQDDVYYLCPSKIKCYVVLNRTLCVSCSHGGIDLHMILLAK